MENKLLNFKIDLALKNVCEHFPHIASLVEAIDLHLDERVETAAITPTGKVLLSPKFAAELDQPGLTFVLAHELYHAFYGTAKRITTRTKEKHTYVNLAHDCIINEMLRKVYAAHGEESLVPKSALFWEAFKLQYRPNMDRHWKPVSEYSLEELALEFGYLSENSPATPDNGSSRCCIKSSKLDPQNVSSASNSESSLQNQSDVLTLSQEQQLFPNETDEATLQAKAKAFDHEIKKAWQKLAPVANAEKQDASSSVQRGNTPGKEKETQGQQKDQDRPKTKPEIKKQIQNLVKGISGSNVNNMQIQALAVKHPVSLDEALQCMEDEYAGRESTYFKPSRRNNWESGLLSKGYRKLKDITLNIIVDTSGSMFSYDLIPKLLGIIESLCQSKNIESARILQCDTEVTSDETVCITDLHDYEVKGGGGSDLTPAMRKLEKDPSVNNVLILTDGVIDYPDTSPSSYNVWWGLTGNVDSFEAPYGQKVDLFKHLSEYGV